MTDVDQIIEEKVKEELGKFDTSKRRTQNEIRDLLQEEISKRPKTIHELQNAVDATKSTVENNVQHLEEVGVAESVEIEDTTYWRQKE